MTINSLIYTHFFHWRIWSILFLWRNSTTFTTHWAFWTSTSLFLYSLTNYISIMLIMTYCQFKWTIMFTCIRLWCPYIFCFAICFRCTKTFFCVTSKFMWIPPYNLCIMATYSFISIMVCSIIITWILKLTISKTIPLFFFMKNFNYSIFIKIISIPHK